MAITMEEGENARKQCIQMMLNYLWLDWHKMLDLDYCGVQVGINEQQTWEGHSTTLPHPHDTIVAMN